MECGCLRKDGCSCPVLSYEDYSSFSMLAVNASIDGMIANAANELSHRMGLSVCELYKVAADA